MDFHFNYNQNVKVKLTEKGVRILKERHKQLNLVIQLRGGSPLSEFKLNLDNEGYKTFQLWDLMNIFGEYMTIGQENVFHGDMIFIGGKPERRFKSNVIHLQ